jgi:hypothetical protein
VSLTFFSLGATLAGVAALAGGLYWLQRLRVRHREVPVVTALFWREAVEETRARELRLRFRHPLAYLFILAICAALWLAAAGLRADARTDRQLVLLLDGSAGMARGTRFDDALGRMREMLAGLPVTKRAAIFCGAVPRTLLMPGEELAWFDRRSAGLAPEAAPSSIEDQLFALATTSSHDRPTTVVVYGDGILDQSALELLPEHFELVLSTDPGTRNASTAGCGITAFGVTPSASGDWTTVDLFIELAGSALREVDLQLAGSPLAQAPESKDTDGRRTLIYRDLAANGERLDARLRGSDDLAADDTASFVLPLRSRVRVQAADGLPSVVARVLTADPAVELVADQAEVQFGPAAVEGSPSFSLSAGDGGIVVRAPADDPSLADFVQRLGSLTGADPIAIEVSATREVILAQAALDADRGWTQSRSFPLFIAAATRWLSSSADEARWVAAGRALGDANARTDVEGRTLDPLGAAFTPPAASVYESATGPALAASLLDSGATTDPDPVFHESGLSVVERDPLDFAHWLALLAFVALLVEWALVRRGRMP